MSDFYDISAFGEEIDGSIAKIKAAEAAGRKLSSTSFNIDQRMRSTSEYVEFDLCVRQEAEIRRIGRQACEVVNFNCTDPAFDQEEFNRVVADFIDNIQSSRKRLNSLLAHYDYLEHAARCYQRVTEARLEAQQVLRHC